MKNKCKRIGLILLGTLAFLCGCKKSSGVIEDVSTLDTTYKVYYLSHDETRIEGVSWNYTGQTPTELVNECIGALRQIPDSSQYISPVSDSIPIIKYEWVEKLNQVNVYFGQEYNSMTKQKEVLTRAAIVKTLTQFDGIIDYVQFFVDNKVLTDSKGRTVTMMASDFVESTSADIKNLDESSLRLYFASSDGQLLAQEDVFVHYQKTAAVESVVMESLISGPLSDTLNRTIAQDTKLNSVTVTDGICYVDMNSRFLDAMENQSFSVKVYSVVNSLCHLDHINSVQILINGQISDYSDGNVNIQSPLSLNEDIVVQPTDVPPVVGNN